MWRNICIFKAVKNMKTTDIDNLVIVFHIICYVKTLTIIGEMWAG